MNFFLEKKRFSHFTHVIAYNVWCFSFSSLHLSHIFHKKKMSHEFSSSVGISPSLNLIVVSPLSSENLIWKCENMRIFIVVTTAVQSLLSRRPHMRSSRASTAHAQFCRASRAKFGTSARHLQLGQKWKLWRNELPREYIGYKKWCISEICQFSDHCRGGATPHQRPGGVRTQKPKNPKGAIFTPFI